MKKILLLIILISNLSFGESFKAHLDTNAILIGQQIKFSIKASNIKSEIIWPNISDSILNGIEIISSSKVDTLRKGKNISFFQEFVITAWDSGAFYIPQFALNENLKSEGLLLNVFYITNKEKEIFKKEFHLDDDGLIDINKQINPKFNIIDRIKDIIHNYWLWIIISIVIIIFIIILNKDKTKIKTIKKAPKIASNLIALKALDNLEKKKLLQSGKIKEYHSKISEIIRSYIEARFNIIALELTTDEIISNIHRKTSAEKTKELNKILSRADLAKFAKSKPNNQDNEESMIIAIEFIKQTTEKKDND